MKLKKILPPIGWTAEDRARHRAIRERFQREKPTLEELVTSGEYNAPVLLGQYYDLTRILAKLKKAREKAGMSLADIAKESGIGKAALSRLENGLRINPTLNTLYRYAAALGINIVLDLEKKNGGEIKVDLHNGPPSKAAKTRK